jgi:hypothetical protein
MNNTDGNVWEKLFHQTPTIIEETLARTIIGKLDTKYSIQFQRAGTQQFCEADSTKDVIGDSVDGNSKEGEDYFLLSDGDIVTTAFTNDTTGNSNRYFTVSNYNYFIKTIIQKDIKGYIKTKHQSVTIRQAKIKYMCQSLLNHLIG